MANKYPNPAAFRQALKERIKRRADERGMLFNRYRQLVLFERFAARVYEACGSDVVVKGGLVMELRFERARTTRDVDALLEGDLSEKLSALRRLAAQSGDDWLSFELGRPESVVEHEGEHIAYEAYRVDVRAQIGGKPFGDPFHFDVSTGDKLVGRPEHQRGTDLFEFVGIEPVEHRVYPREVHVAEKLHAWSLPRDRPNSRVKDLVDLGLMAEGLEFDGESLREAIDATFEFRDTHPVPETVPEVPESWPRQYRRLEDENGLPWDSVEELAGVVEGFVRPILQGTEVGEWDPERGDRW
jgi:hypothetical protein